jgi:hypothetical protein
MKRSLSLLFAIAAFAGCSSDEPGKNESGTCSTPAVVKDMTGLDGCGFVFQLQDGSVLEPFIVFECGTPPLPPDPPANPLTGFEFIDGKKVMIDYELVDDAGSICMVGKVARITCITEARSQSEEK